MSVSRLRLRRVAAVAAVTTATVGGSVFAVAQTREPAPNAADPTDRPQARAVPEQVVERFAVFRRAKRPADELPSRAGHDGGYGANPGLSRLATTTPSGEKVFLVAANDGICLATPSGGMQLCGPLKEDPGATVAAAGFTACGPGVPAGRYRVFGVMSDGVASVDLVRPGGGKSTIPVEGNVWVAELSSREPAPTRVRWNGPDGAHDEQSPVPADAIGGTCLS